VKAHTTEELKEISESVFRKALWQLTEATEEEFLGGETWYQTAHDRAQALLDDPVQAAEMIAVLSPQVEWEHNIKDAEQMVLERDATWAYKANVAKAMDILDGKALAQVTKFAPKCSAFAHNIAYPEGCPCECVTIDRHICRALDIYDKTLERKGVYEAVSVGIRRAAKAFGLKPHQAQAIMWLHQKNQEVV